MTQYSYLKSLQCKDSLDWTIGLCNAETQPLVDIWAPGFSYVTYKNKCW